MPASLKLTVPLDSPVEGPDTPAFDATFRAYSRYVAGVAVRILGRDDEVDDVVQDVFLDAWKGLSGLREPAAVRGWLATVTVRVASRRLRARRIRRFFFLEKDTDYESVAAEGATSEHRLLLARVYEVLDRLPVAERVPWTLRYVEREQIDVIAKMCGCSMATVKRRIGAAQSIIEEALS